jgi:DNA-binding NtrC family response regulator
VAPACHDPLDVAIPGSTLADIERAAILKSVMAVGGRATEAAAMLGISKSKIYYRLRDYGSYPARRDDRDEADPDAVIDALPPREPAAARR